MAKNASPSAIRGNSLLTETHENSTALGYQHCSLDVVKKMRIYEGFLRHYDQGKHTTSQLLIAKMMKQ